jgi:hypothetical protein
MRPAARQAELDEERAKRPGDHPPAPARTAAPAKATPASRRPAEGDSDDDDKDEDGDVSPAAARPPETRGSVRLGPGCAAAMHAHGWGAGVRGGCARAVYGAGGAGRLHGGSALDRDRRPRRARQGTRAAVATAPVAHSRAACTV